MTAAIVSIASMKGHRANDITGVLMEAMCT
jgi:hypothetical protein